MNEHAHYWIIEVAAGPKSKGYCKHCGEVQEFSNVINDGDLTWRRQDGTPVSPTVTMDDETEVI